MRSRHRHSLSIRRSKVDQRRSRCWVVSVCCWNKECGNSSTRFNHQRRLVSRFIMLCNGRLTALGIIISAWSSGNSFLYLSSRSLYSLAVTGNAPRCFKGISDHSLFCCCSPPSSLQSMGRSLLGCHRQFSLCWTRVSQCVQFGFGRLQLVCELDEYIRLH